MTKPLQPYGAVKASAQARRAEKVAKQRKRGVKKRNPERGGHRFQGREIPELRAFVSRLPCLLYGADVGTRCYGATENAHVVSRGAGGEDFDNLVPLCHRHHMQSHFIGQKSFERLNGLRLAPVARKVTAKWLKESASFLAERGPKA